MNLFVNRESELRSLCDVCGEKGASLYVLYGRRRLGKTALLQRFAQGRDAIYYMADRSTEKDALRLMAQAMALALGEPSLDSGEYRDWYGLFAAFDRLRPKDRKQILIFDEFQYLCEAQPAFSSYIQKWWDQSWSKGDFMLILCGSLLSMMYKETLSRESPLYGRRTGQWLLKPLRFRELGAMFQKFSPRALVEMFSLTGGVPRYAELATKHRSFSEAFEKLVLNKGGALYSEATFLLTDVVNTPNVYWSILRMIGSGVNRISELAGRVGIPANQLTRYLSVLQELGMIRRETPVTAPLPHRSKKGIYQMDDPFLRLWFGVVASQESLLEFGQTQKAKAAMAPALVHHHAWAFEMVCRQHIENELGRWDGATVGKYWDRHCEIDIVAVNEKRAPVLAAECKWRGKLTGIDVAEALEQKVRNLWPSRENSIQLALFSVEGFTDAAREWAENNDALLFECKDLV